MAEIQFSRLTEATKVVADDINCLLPQLSSTQPYQISLDYLRFLVQHTATFIYTVVSSGHVVGMLAFVGYYIPTGEKWQLEDFVLDQSLRGRGVAREFLVWALDDFRHFHPDVKIHLTSRPSREAANALYRSLGFTSKETNNYIIEP